MWSRLRFFTLLAIVCVVTTSGLSGVTSYQTGGTQVAAAASSGGFDAVLAWVIAGGYVFMFAAMVIEGPIVTAAASFAAALGYFNIWIVLLLAILGDLTGDIGYYWFGYIGRVALVEKYGHRIGLSSKRMKKIEQLLKSHPGKTLLAVKLTFATPGLIMVGVTRMPFRKFMTYCALIILPKVLLFVTLGYYFGRAYDSISHYIQNAEYFIVVAIILTLIAYYAYNKLSAMLSHKLQVV